MLWQFHLAPLRGSVVVADTVAPINPTCQPIPTRTSEIQRRAISKPENATAADSPIRNNPTAATRS